MYVKLQNSSHINKGKRPTEDAGTYTVAALRGIRDIVSGSKSSDARNSLVTMSNDRLVSDRPQLQISGYIFRHRDHSVRLALREVK